MSGPYCETCTHFHPNMMIAKRRGECTDPTKAIFFRYGDRATSAPDVQVDFYCSNHETPPDTGIDTD